MEITRLVVINWVQDGKTEFGEYNVGSRGVIKIEEHTPQVEVDKWYYNIYFKDGTMLREFKPVTVIFTEV